MTVSTSTDPGFATSLAHVWQQSASKGPSHLAAQLYSSLLSTFVKFIVTRWSSLQLSSGRFFVVGPYVLFASVAHAPFKPHCVFTTSEFWYTAKGKLHSCGSVGSCLVVQFAAHAAGVAGVAGVAGFVAVGAGVGGLFVVTSANPSSGNIPACVLAGETPSSGKSAAELATLGTTAAGNGAGVGFTDGIGTMPDGQE